MPPNETLGRVARLGVAACATLIGCDVGEPPPSSAPARELFLSRAWPALGRCGGCHASQPSIDFMAPGTPDGAYTTVFDYQPPVVDVDSPASSLLLTMGKHTGPELLPAEAAAVLAWIEAEREAGVVAPPRPNVVGPIALRLGALNQIALPADGGILQLVPADSGSGTLSITELELRAGTRGLRVEHPVFSSIPSVGPPVVDATDRYSDVDLELAPNAALRLGGGAALFTAFRPTDPIAIHFRQLEAP